MSAQRVTSTFEFDEDMLKELIDARDRKLNRLDARVYVAVLGAFALIWVWGCFVADGIGWIGLLTAILIFPLLAFEVFEMVTGRTVLWFGHTWDETFIDFFDRHGVDVTEPRPWHFTCRCSAKPHEVRICVLDDQGDETRTVTRTYDDFAYVEQTEHLIVLVANSYVEPVWQSFFDKHYAERLADRDRTDDAVWRKDAIKGMTSDELVAYLNSKVEKNS